MKVEITVWDSKERLREKVIDVTRLLLSCAVFGMIVSFKRNWIIFGIQGLYILLAAIILISKSKWDKNINASEILKDG